MSFAAKNAFRQVCDKPCANRIVQAEWSPQRDLIAIITSNGEVRLHRLYWQKVWTIQAKDNHAVYLTWKPDSSMLTVGYEDGGVSLYEIEKASIVHKLSCSSKVTCLQWAYQSKSDFDIIYKDKSESFYPDIDKEDLEKSVSKTNLLISDQQYSVLTVGTSNGDVYLFIDGVFPLAKVTSPMFCSTFKSCSIVKCNLLLNLGMLTVITNSSEDDETPSSFFLFQLESPILNSRAAELCLISLKFVKISNLIHQCSKVLKQMADASEDIFIKINSKLEKLESLVSATGSNVAAEFTIAYASGVTSPELQTFLTQHLTTKGLKQIAQSVQSGYTSLHNDIKDEVELLMQRLLFLFVELQGMSQCHEKFSILGLSVASIQKCIALVLQFIMKSKELLKVITDDMKNFKVFFNWLARLVFHISGEQSLLISNQLSNEDFDIMLAFLENRLMKVDKTNGDVGYDFERVSQFFNKGTLYQPAFTTDNEWYKFLEENETLKDNPLIIRPDLESTLFEIFCRLQEHTNQVFEIICRTMSASFEMTTSSNLYKEAQDHEEECNSNFAFHYNSPSLLFSILPCSCDSDSMFFIEITPTKQMQAISLFASSATDDTNCSTSEDLESMQYTLRDAKFYNSETVSILFEEKEKTNDGTIATIFGQVPLSCITTKQFLVLPLSMQDGVLDQELPIPSFNIKDLISEQRRMDSFCGKYLSLNGHLREVSCVVSMSGRRIRIFDMTAEDDDIEESKLEDDSQILSEG